MIHRTSALVLILANLIPLAGASLFQWDVLAILLLYWAESVIVGVLNVFRIIAWSPDNALGGVLSQLVGQSVLVREELRKSVLRVVGIAIKVVLVVLFVLHYALFCGVHLIAVLVFFSAGEVNPRIGATLAELWQGSFWISVAAIFFSHLFSFFKNYIGRGEYKMVSVNLLMFRPYGRIVAMHLAIVLGAGLFVKLGSPLPVLLILIVAKTVLDMRLHVKERGILATPATNSRLGND